MATLGGENNGAARGIGNSPSIINCYNGGEVTANPSKISQYGGPSRNWRSYKWRSNI